MIIAVIGNENSGKSTWIRRLSTGELLKDKTELKCKMTVDNNLYIEVDYKTSNLSDYDGLIIFEDNTDLNLYKQFRTLLPTVVVISRSDLQVNSHLSKSLSRNWCTLKAADDMFFEISSFSNYNFDKPTLRFNC
jgi:GTPase SAR1 family protein